MSRKKYATLRDPKVYAHTEFGIPDTNNIGYASDKDGHTHMHPRTIKLEDLKVLRRSPDLLNNVKIGQGQLQLIMEQI